MEPLDKEIMWAVSGTGEDFQCVDASCARELWAEIERQRAELRTLREQHVTSMNIEHDGSYLLICEGNHHRSEKCEYVRYARAL